MGKRYKDLLHDIFSKKILAEDFSLYLHRPTATDARFAPEGCDSFYVLCPVPNLQGDVDWAKQGPLLQDRIVTALEKSIMPDLRNVITEDFYMTPEDFKADYRSEHGAGFSISPASPSLPGSGIITVIRIWQICIFQEQVHIPVLVCLACSVQPKLLKRWLAKMNGKPHMSSPRAEQKQQGHIIQLRGAQP